MMYITDFKNQALYIVKYIEFGPHGCILYYTPAYNQSEIGKFSMGGVLTVSRDTLHCSND